MQYLIKKVQTNINKRKYTNYIELEKIGRDKLDGAGKNIPHDTNKFNQQTTLTETKPELHVTQKIHGKRSSWYVSQQRPLVLT